MDARRTLVWAAALVAGCAPGDGQGSPGTPAPAAGPLPARRAVLLVCDTLRADRLGSLGSTSGATPNLDRLAGDSLAFERAYATASMTVPSMCSVMTGLYAADVGAVPGNTSMMPGEVETLAERLGDEGWVTGAVVSNYALRSWSDVLGDRSVWQGFDHYDHEMTDAEQNRPGQFERSAAATTAAAADWLRARARAGEDRLFLWVHYQDPHGPYTPPAEYERRFRGPVRDDVRVPIGQRNTAKERIPRYQAFGDEDRVDVYLQRYEAEVAAFDAALGELLDVLRELGWYDDSLIVFTADHGESLGEHGYWFGHGEHVHEEVVRVPLMLRLPGGRLPDWAAGGRTTRLAGHVDLRPTVEQALGLAPTPGRGVSLLEPPREGRVLLQRVFPSDANDGLCAVTDGAHRLLWRGEGDAPRLFDLRADPDELRDVAAERPEVVADLLARRDAHLRETAPASAHEGSAAPLDEAATDALRKLGYVDGGD